MNQVINMVIRMVMRRLINLGINKGIDAASRRGKKPDELTPEQRRRAGEQSGRTKKSMRLLRRFSRF